MNDQREMTFAVWSSRKKMNDREFAIAFEAWGAAMESSRHKHQAALAQPRAPISDAQIRELDVLINAFGNAEFACGEWDMGDLDDLEDYELFLNRARAAKTALRNAVLLLAAQGDMGIPISEAITGNPVFESAQDCPSCGVSPNSLHEPYCPEAAAQWQKKWDAAIAASTPKDNP